MESHIRSLIELEAEAIRFLKTLVPNSKQATLVLLSGELGAGKTAFVKEIAKALGVEEVVNSPTFVLEKIYALPQPATFKRLVHIDAYRLEKDDSLLPLGFDEIMKDSGNLILLEWPERVAEMISSSALRISFAVGADGSRTISYG